MLDTENYSILESKGYANKSDAYAHIRLWYSYMSGVTTYYDNGMYYIAQSKALM